MNSLEFSVNDLSTLLSKIYFVPVNVKHGRKFRGLGFVVDQRVVDNGGFSGSGVRPRYFYTVFKVWDPAHKRFDSFNSAHQCAFRGAEKIRDLHEDEVTVSDKITLPAFLGYVQNVAEACLRRCGNDLNWRRNYLRMVLTGSPEALDILCTAIERARTAEDPGNREERLLAEREYLADMQKNA